MRFALPMADGKLSAHFGHCKEFALIDVEENEIKTKEMLKPPPHEPGALPKWLNDLGTHVVIAAGLGHQAISLFNQAGITVVTGAPSEKPETLVRRYLKKTLVDGDNLCSVGDHHQCSH